MSQTDYAFRSVKDKSGNESLRVAARSPQLTESERSEIISDSFPLVSAYNPSELVKKVTAEVRDHFLQSDVAMRKPRREFNDMSVLSRHMVDQMSFNGYQPNNGDPAAGDYIQGWKSNAFRPIVRNKCISIAAHTTARLIYPNVFAWNSDSEYQEESALVMKDLFRFATDQMNYSFLSLRLILTSLWSPAAIGYTEYAEVERTVRDKNERGEYEERTMLDDVLSGFRGEVVPVDELYIADIYENNIQKQPYLIRRRVKFYSTVKDEYGHLENFQYVRPGVQVMINDANQLFYEVYDSVMRQNMVEEIIYWNRSKDLKLVFLNGILMTDPRNPNPRIDKNYPFFKFGFELMDEGSFFYYKSLAFKIAQDATIVNTLYPMIVDGTYLSIIPPLLNTTGETLPSNVVVPGAVTNMSKPNEGQITPLEVAKNMAIGFNTLTRVEDAIGESSPQLQFTNRAMRAYEIAIRQQEANILLGLFTAMIGDYVRQMGQLLISDILQYMTIAEVKDIVDDNKLVYKSFLVQNKNKDGSKTHRRIKFDDSLPDNPDEKELLELSLETLKMQGGMNSKVTLCRANPRLFRELKFSIQLSKDVLNPLSEEVERAFRLEVYDRAINNPVADQEKVTKEFLFGAFPESNHDPEAFIKKKDEQNQTPQLPPTAPPQAPSPLGNVQNMTGAAKITNSPRI